MSKLFSGFQFEKPKPKYSHGGGGTRGTPRQHIEVILESAAIAVLLEGMRMSPSELQPTWANGALVLIDPRHEEEALARFFFQTSRTIQK